MATSGNPCQVQDVKVFPLPLGEITGPSRHVVPSMSNEPCQEPILLPCRKCAYRAYLSECENSRLGMSREERVRLLARISHK